MTAPFGFGNFVGGSGPQGRASSIPSKNWLDYWRRQIEEGTEQLGGLAYGISGGLAGLGHGEMQRRELMAGRGMASDPEATFARGHARAPGIAASNQKLEQAREKYMEGGGSAGGAFMAEATAPTLLDLPFGSGAKVLKGAAALPWKEAGLFLATPWELAKNKGMGKYLTNKPLPFRATDRPPGKGYDVARAQIEGKEARLRELIDKPGAREVGENWYDVSPLRDALYDELPADQAETVFQLFGGFMGAGSPVSDVEKNVERALYWLNAHQGRYGVGNLTLPGSGANRVKPYSPIGALAGYQSHMPMAARVQSAVMAGDPVVGLRSVGGALDPTKTAKVPRFADAILGNWSAAPADRHAVRPIWDIDAPTHSQAEAYEKFHQDVLAPSYDLLPSQTMASQWVGGAADTNVTDARGMMEQINDVVKRLASAQGKTELETFRDILQGNLPVGYARDLPTGGQKVTKELRKAWDSIKYQEVSPEDYVKAQGNMDRAQMLTPYSADELTASGARTFLSDDGKIGYTLATDGDFGGLFSLHTDKKVSGLGMSAMEDAIDRGATKLDAFNVLKSKDPLTEKYRRHGAVTVDRFSFDPKQVPKDWDYKRYGNPSVEMMEIWKRGKKQPLGGLK